MRPGQEIRVFDRDDWRRKVRVPSWARREENGSNPTSSADRKVTEKW